MGMSMHIVGIVTPTEEYKKKVEAYYACENAGIPIPEALETYFHGEPPNPKGMELRMEGHESVEKFSDSYPREGFTVDLTKIPKNIRFIRFYNSY